VMGRFHLILMIRQWIGQGLARFCNRVHLNIRLLAWRIIHLNPDAGLQDEPESSCLRAKANAAFRAKLDWD